jgi:FkbM family methyltransferase
MKMNIILEDILSYDNEWRDSLYMDIFHNGEYEYENVYVEKDDIVVDLGANIGMFSLYAISKGAKFIYAFEPVQENIDIYKKNLNEYTNVKLYEAGISYKNAISDIFYNFQNNTILSEVYNDFGWGSEDEKTERVNLISINDFLDNINKVDYMKFDIEGSEYDALENITIDNLNKIRKIGGEFHWNYQNRLNKSVEKLEENGFTVYIINTNDINKMGKFFAKNEK